MRGDNEYIFISGIEITKFSTEDNFIDFVSLMYGNMIPSAIAIGEKHICFISDCYKIVENKKIEEGTLLNSTNHSLDPFDYQFAKGVDRAYKLMECNQIHSFHPNEDGEGDNEEEDITRAQRELDDWVKEQTNLDKPKYCNGNNEMVKIFNQKCVICFENPSGFAFRPSGHQCICEDWWTNSNAEKLKRAVVELNFFNHSVSKIITMLVGMKNNLMI